QPDASHDLPSTHIGLANLRERLARHYPERHTFITETGDGWVIARLTLRPLRSG
ncbi:MAG: hypothetical protein RLZZ15_906, partial [Verrucomicrobiota bacterium]